MPEQVTLRRPILLASAGIVTATILYLAFAAYTKSPGENAGLRRSNAVRRSRRQWRRGHPPRELNNDPVSEAIRHLHGRNAAHQPYGQYNNQILFNPTQEALEQGRYDLLPTNLGPMVRDLSQRLTLTDLEREVLNHHVESMFIQNFLIEEFPAGYIIGEDVESLVHAFRNDGISESVVRIMAARFDIGKPPAPVNWDLHEEIHLGPDISADDGPETVTARNALEALTGQAEDSDSDGGWGHNDGESDPGGSQGMLDLLYHIAGEQAQRDGLIHREVRCNSCGAGPIRGIRYHCANCFDYDLCETCEAQQLHSKNHVFYKIRIPAPLRGHIKQVAPVWYPGDPNAFLDSLPERLSKTLMDAYGMEKTELDALYEHFKCLAGHQMPRDSDPTRLGVAISRKNFDYYFTTTSDDRSPPQNLIYDRIFAFYDANYDDLITFDEFVRGMLALQDRTRAARAYRMFQGYDLDSDGYVSRRDFLRMLRAYYAWQKELHKERTIGQEELDDDVRDAVHGTQPISAAFPWSGYAGHASRGGRDKSLNVNGDLEISNGPNGVLQNNSDVRGDRAKSIGNAAVRGQTRLGGFRSFRQEEPADEPVVDLLYPEMYFRTATPDRGDAREEDLMGSDPANHIYGWPPDDMPERVDIVNSIGADLSVEEIMDPIDRARVIYAQAQRVEDQGNHLLSEARRSALEERWKHRQFYLDEEEGMSRPPGYTEPDSSDDDILSETGQDNHVQTFPFSSNSRRQSMRSRSSSKVRFEDSAFDTDHETRSNASSRSIPLNERWGGFELGEPERDIGKEILYQTIQQGFNQLLDPLFKAKEEQALQAISTKAKRLKWQTAMTAYQNKLLEVAGGIEHKLDTNSTDHHLPASNSSTRPRTSSPARLVLGYETETDSLDATSPNALGDSILPHYRPNDDFTTKVLENSANKDDSLGQSTNGKDPIIPPPDTTLALWLEHEAIEQEAIVRGGYGRLSFKEFKRNMVEESIEHIKTNLDTGSADETEEIELWSSTADLGRLSFLGNWLEMARF